MDTQISGVVVTVPPARLVEASRRLRALPGVDVHHVDVATGRIVVTLETSGDVDPEAELRHIQSLPDVLGADLVYHVVESGADSESVGGGSR
ncbi:MAG: chaperone NapD [Planctomycetes bacterium]|nr:chaperone NapD [Planctomycetota bacterium]MBI3845690.1 chaperone NapD [Planctomycetota bacterium]